MIDEHWTVNAVLPWPGVSYAPSTNTIFRLGVMPSGASWTFDAGDNQPRIDLSAWDAGLSAQRRMHGGFWGGAEVGYSGIRRLSVVDGAWRPIEIKLDEAPYALVTFNFRPSAR